MTKFVIFFRGRIRCSPVHSTADTIHTGAGAANRKVLAPRILLAPGPKLADVSNAPIVRDATSCPRMCDFEAQRSGRRVELSVDVVSMLVRICDEVALTMRIVR